MPPDVEGERQLGRVPILQVPKAGDEHALPARVAAILRAHPVCLVMGQGVYARGATLLDANRVTSRLELSAQIALMARTM
jgi:ribulose-5-phosphate 4-epimerase/fuculose-1-phosphate aldolase